jgi:DNA-binding LytR/AlgR family response regulator
MNIAICEEKNGELIKNKTVKYMKEKNIAPGCFVFQKAVDLMVSNEIFDILILSSEFSEISAQISTYLKRHNNEVAIIFTADDYSNLNDAFDIGAIRYLINPIDEALSSALDCAINYINTQTTECYLENNGIVKRVSKSSILYLEISGRKTKIVTDKECYYSRFRMQDFQKALNPAQFASPHKSFYVNLGQVTECRRFGGQYYLCMSDNKYIPITRTRKSEFEKAYYKFIENKKLT